MRLFATCPLRVDLLEERHAPLAPGTGPQALTKLRRHTRPLAIHEVDKLSQANAVTEADMVVRFHRCVLRTTG